MTDRPNPVQEHLPVELRDARRRPQGRPDSVSLLVERLCWVIAAGCLLTWGFFYITGSVGAQREMARFERERAASHVESRAPDLSLWSPKRIKAWRDSLAEPAPAPLGVLRIDRIDLEVPVLEGTDDWTLNRAVGHIEDTARLGGEGNIGIAGHRDGFFRGLKDILVGDALVLETLDGTTLYRVERTWIVDPEDVSVLSPTPEPAITLVTCYPFYFVGSAPRRFIVRAVRTGFSHTTARFIRRDGLNTP